MFSQRFLEERRQALRRSIDYFKSANIDERNRWTCVELLTNIGETFDEWEVVVPASDPPRASAHYCPLPPDNFIGPPLPPELAAQRARERRPARFPSAPAPEA